MKTPILAALLLMSSAAVATAEIGPANSTNQHLRDSANFYDNVPDFGFFSRDRTGGVDAEREAGDRSKSRAVTR